MEHPMIPRMVSNDFSYEVNHSTQNNNLEIKFYDQNNTQPFIRNYQGNEYEQLVQQCQQLYPHMSQKEAILSRLNNAIQKSQYGDIAELALFLQKPSQAFTDEMGIKIHQEGQERHNLKDEQGHAQYLQSKEYIQKLLEENKDNVAETDLARKQFEKGAIVNNTYFLNTHLSELELCNALRTNPESRIQLYKGLKPFVENATAFFSCQTPKRLCDLLNVSVYKGDVKNQAEALVEQKLKTWKLAITNAYVSTKNNEIEFKNPSENVKEVLAFETTAFVQKLVPELVPYYLKQSQYLSAFGVVNDYIEVKKGSMLNKFKYYLVRMGDNGIYLYNKNIKIDTSPAILHDNQFQQLLILNDLCSKGYIDQARTKANPHSKLEQALIAEYIRLQPQSFYEQVQYQQQVSAQNSNHRTVMVAFPVNNHAATIIQEYGKNINEITDFKPTSWNQLVTEAFIVDGINKQADRVFTSQSITEQAIAMHVIDGLVIAHDLNKRNEIENISEFLIHASKETGEHAAHFISKFLSRLEHNAMHPIEYIKEQVMGTAQLGYFIADVTIGQLFRTQEEREVYFNELKNMANELGKQMQNASAKDISEVVATIMADIVFDGGIGYLAKLGKTFYKQMPKMVAKVGKVAEKIGEIVQEEKQFVVMTPEGTKIPVSSRNLAEEAHLLKSSNDKVHGTTKKIGKNEKQILSKEIEQVRWASDYHKHKPPQNVAWKDIVRSTTYGDAKYKPEINIKELELHAWKNGQPVTIPGKNWKVFKCDEIIGANSGKETCYMRVECSANTIHGHPISESNYLRYLKK